MLLLGTHYCRMEFKSEAICVRCDYRLEVGESHLGVTSRDDAVRKYSTVTDDGMQDLKSLMMDDLGNNRADDQGTFHGKRLPGGVDVPRRQGEGLAIVSVGTGDVL